MVGLLYRVLIVTTVIAGCYGALDISKYLKVCDRNSVDVNDCMIEAVQMGLAAMADGIKDLDVPSLDPYHQKELKLEYNNNQISAKMNIKDIYVVGLKDATVLDARVKADDDRLHLEIDLKAPKVFVKGTYKGAGQYNALKLDAYGEFNTTMSGLVWTWKLDGIPEKIGSNTYVRINSLYMRPNVENMVSHLNNENAATKDWSKLPIPMHDFFAAKPMKLGPNHHFTDLGNSFVNSNWRVLYGELVPFAQANWNKTGIRIANKIFLKVPYDEMFPISS